MYISYKSLPVIRDEFNMMVSWPDLTDLILLIHELRTVA